LAEINIENIYATSVMDNQIHTFVVDCDNYIPVFLDEK